MWEIFSKNPVQYNLKKGHIVYLPRARSSCNGVNYLAFRVICLFVFFVFNLFYFDNKNRIQFSVSTHKYS